MKLSKRLNKICDLIDFSKSIADVGTDHGKVVAKLFLDNKIDFAYVTDISEPSVRKAEKLLIELDIDKSRYEVVVTDGLNNIETNFIDTVIIAGMGGLEIIKILNENKIDVNTFILAPNNNDVNLRKYLNKNNYKINKDFVVKDSNKYYNIIKVSKGNEKLSKIHKYFGKTNFENPTNDFKDYLNNELNKSKNLIKKLPFVKKIKFHNYIALINKANRSLRGRV